MSSPKNLHVTALVASAFLLGALLFREDERQQAQDKTAPASQDAVTPTILPKPAPQPDSTANLSIQTLNTLPDAERDVFMQFQEWTAVLPQPGAPMTQSVLDEGVRLAAERRQALKQLIQKNPQAAIELAVPWQTRNRLPSEIVALLEQRVSEKADYSVLAAVHGADGIDPGPAIRREAVIDGKVMQAHVYGTRERVDSKRALPIEGIAVDDQLAILDSPLRRLEPGEPLPEGAMKTAVSPEHQSRVADAVSSLWISGGTAYQVCCETHAARLAGDLSASEQTPGPLLEASGGQGSSQPGKGEVGASSWTEGVKTLLVIRVDFSDLAGAPVDGSANVMDSAYLTNRITTEVSPWITEVSYNKSSMTLQPADVTAVLRMPNTAASYATSGLNNNLRLDALALATTAGFTPDNYDRVALVFSRLSAIPGSQITYAGLGQIGDSFTWYNGNFSQGVVVHEFGHNFGLRHANLWQIPGGSTDPVAPGGTSTEYGDVFDMMGGSPTNTGANLDHFNPWFLNRIDWLPNTAVQTPAASGSFRIYRYDHPSAVLSNALALRIGRNSQQNYWIGYRRKFAGHATHSDGSAGAYIIWGHDYQDTSKLIDLDTPGTDAKDASLNVGSTFHDNAAGLHFTVMGAGGSGTAEYIDVAVAFDARISFSQSSYDVDEASGNLAVVLNRTNNSTGPVSVTLSTSNGTATAPADYTASSTLVSWASGDFAPKTVNIPIVADASAEGSESFTLTLSGITGGIILNNATVTANIREPGAEDSGFAHGFFNNSSSVRKLVVQPDGRIAFAGRASNIASTPVNGVGRFEVNGALDTAFIGGSGANSLPVNAIARQADGKLVVAGSFTTLHGVARVRVARLNEDGSLDTSFNPGTGPDNVVNDIVIRPDGRIIIGGYFLNVAGTARAGVAQLLPDGSLDTTFLATPIPGIVGTDIECLALQADGKVLFGGQLWTNFAAIFPNGFASGVLRLNTNGTVDTSFNIGTGAHTPGSVGSLRRVWSIAVEPDGQVVLGGDFTAFNGTSVNRIVRVNSNGALDSSFTTAVGTGANDSVRSIGMQGDGRILIGGYFTDVAGQARTRVGRLLATGAVDTTFAPVIPLTYSTSSPNYCYQVLMQPDTRVLITLDSFGGTQSGIKRVFSAQAAPTGQVEFVPGGTSASEGGSAAVAVRRVGGSLGQISISYATLPGTATAADFTAQTGTLVWADGDATDKTITIPATADATTEPDEFFNVQLGTPVGGTSLAANGVTSVQISDVSLSPLEQWRQTHFGSSANSGSGADLQDADHDALLNLMEYALARNPNSASAGNGAGSLPYPVSGGIEAVLAGRLVIVCDLPESPPADVIYHIEANTSPGAVGWAELARKTGAGAWTWQAGGTSRIIESTASGRTTVKVADVELISAGAPRFMRLRVSGL
jgi:uncharacterized delta-60 repeat protein